MAVSIIDKLPIPILQYIVSTHLSDLSVYDYFKISQTCKTFHSIVQSLILSFGDHQSNHDSLNFISKDYEILPPVTELSHFKYMITKKPYIHFIIQLSIFDTTNLDVDIILRVEQTIEAIAKYRRHKDVKITCFFLTEDAASLAFGAQKYLYNFDHTNYDHFKKEFDVIFKAYRSSVKMWKSKGKHRSFLKISLSIYQGDSYKGLLKEQYDGANSSTDLQQNYDLFSIGAHDYDFGNELKVLPGLLIVPTDQFTFSIKASNLEKISGIMNIEDTSKSYGEYEIERFFKQSHLPRVRIYEGARVVNGFDLGLFARYFPLLEELRVRSLNDVSQFSRRVPQTEISVACFENLKLLELFGDAVTLENLRLPALRTLKISIHQSYLNNDALKLTSKLKIFNVQVSDKMEKLVLSFESSATRSSSSIVSEQNCLIEVFTNIRFPNDLKEIVIKDQMDNIINLFQSKGGIYNYFPTNIQKLTLKTTDSVDIERNLILHEKLNLFDPVRGWKLPPDWYYSLTELIGDEIPIPWDQQFSRFHTLETFKAVINFKHLLRLLLQKLESSNSTTGGCFVVHIDPDNFPTLRTFSLDLINFNFFKWYNIKNHNTPLSIKMRISVKGITLVLKAIQRKFCEEFLIIDQDVEINVVYI
ncbi:hypothetical protein WICPIJ_009278 [Wickerhamomyces pijperi]|uniref:F-box domain-containing protein n=1 Tax=Wickerhamomyces pijperi TaxID=599730 RepID=A0A9P8TDR1_WICPI|nr:hypothetical protein WICPIJ_009278 [Wickerhamomyces pijperi]